MDSTPNLALVWPWAVVFLPLPWLIARWLKSRLSSNNSIKAKGALKLPAVDLYLVPSVEKNASQFPFLTKLSWRTWLWALLVLALMRPEWQQPEVEVTYESRQILLLVDISGSMNELLQGRTRLDQVKQVVRDFIQQRPRDHLGLVVFGGQAYLYVPRTLDHELLIQQLQSLQPGMAGPGTAIGDALGVGVSHLLQSKGKPAILLLTDGDNNAGQLKPEQALAMAAAADIPTHLVVVDLEVKPELAKAINKTGGQVFSAFSQQELANVYQQIHKLEPQTQVGYLRPSFSLAYIPLVLALLLAISQTAFVQRQVNKFRSLKVRSANE